MRLRPPQAGSLYIQDTAELLRVVDDAARQMAVFLNLFSGSPGIPRRAGSVGAGGAAGVGGAAAVELEEDAVYHGVVSYATLLNAYGGILEERDLREALIHDTGGDNALKRLVVLYLSLVHLARYQVARREVMLKLDPLDEIIGDGSVGAVAVRRHLHAGLRFNYLGFLAEVRNSTRAWANGPPASPASRPQPVTPAAPSDGAPLSPSLGPASGSARDHH
jgi:hypothetical protein